MVLVQVSHTEVPRHTASSLCYGDGHSKFVLRHDSGTAVPKENSDEQKYGNCSKGSLRHPSHLPPQASGTNDRVQVPAKELERPCCYWLSILGNWLHEK